MRIVHHLVPLDDLWQSFHFVISLCHPERSARFLSCHPERAPVLIPCHPDRSRRFGGEVEGPAVGTCRKTFPRFVIPSERSESRDLHFLVQPTIPEVALAFVLAQGLSASSAKSAVAFAFMT